MNLIKRYIFHKMVKCSVKMSTIKKDQNKHLAFYGEIGLNSFYHKIAMFYLLLLEIKFEILKMLL